MTCNRFGFVFKPFIEFDFLADIWRIVVTETTQAAHVTASSVNGDAKLGEVFLQCRELSLMLAWVLEWDDDKVTFSAYRVGGISDLLNLT